MTSNGRLLNSQSLYQGKIFTIKKDELKTRSGLKVVREVVDHPGSVAVVPLLDHQTILMVRQYRHPVGKVLLEIPAGTLNKSERPQECARRELIEETGYQAGRLKKILQCYLTPGYSSELIHIYLATELSNVKHTSEADEFIKLSKIKTHKIPDMIRRKQIEDAKTICGISALISPTLTLSPKLLNV